MTETNKEELTRLLKEGGINKATKTLKARSSEIYGLIRSLKINLHQIQEDAFYNVIYQYAETGKDMPKVSEITNKLGYPITAFKTTTNRLESKGKIVRNPYSILVVELGKQADRIGKNLDENVVIQKEDVQKYVTAMRSKHPIVCCATTINPNANENDFVVGNKIYDKDRLIREGKEILKRRQKSVAVL